MYNKTTYWKLNANHYSSGPAIHFTSGMIYKLDANSERIPCNSDSSGFCFSLIQEGTPWLVAATETEWNQQEGSQQPKSNMVKYYRILKSDWGFEKGDIGIADYVGQPQRIRVPGRTSTSGLAPYAHYSCGSIEEVTEAQFLVVHGTKPKPEEVKEAYEYWKCLSASPNSGTYQDDRIYVVKGKDVYRTMEDMVIGVSKLVLALHPKHSSSKWERVTKADFDAQEGTWQYARVIESILAESYTKDKIYKVKSIVGSTLLTELDDRGSTTNGWRKNAFVSATKAEYDAQQRPKVATDTLVDAQEYWLCVSNEHNPDAYTTGKIYTLNSRREINCNLGHLSYKTPETSTSKWERSTKEAYDIQEGYKVTLPETFRGFKIGDWFLHPTFGKPYEICKVTPKEFGIYYPSGSKLVEEVQQHYSFVTYGEKMKKVSCPPEYLPKITVGYTEIPAPSLTFIGRESTQSYTSEEVLWYADTEEAEKRGFIKGCRYKNTVGEEFTAQHNPKRYDAESECKGSLILGDGQGLLYDSRTGKWGALISTPLPAAKLSSTELYIPGKSGGLDTKLNHISSVRVDLYEKVKVQRF